MGHLILAVDLGDVLPLVVFLIAIMSGIGNFIKEKKSAAAREQDLNRSRQEPRDKSLQSEIDTFLSEVSDAAPARPRSQSSSSQGSSSQGSSSQGSSSRGSSEQQQQQRQQRRMQQSQQKQQQKKKQQQAGQSTSASQGSKPTPVARVKPAGDPPGQSAPVARRHLPQEELSGVRDRHVASLVDQRHIASPISSQHIQPTVITVPESSSQNGAHPIAQMLCHPGSVRTAFILNEVLSPPVSRRK